MDIRRVTDRAMLEAFHAIEAAAHDHDYRGLPADPIDELAPLLEDPRTAGELVELYLGSVDGAPVASLTFTLFTLENLNAANLTLNVHPSHRRQGVATAFADWAIKQVQLRGRTRIFMEVPSGADGSPPLALALMSSIGAKGVLDDYRRLLDLGRHPVGEPLAAPDGYRVVQWVDRCPDDLVDGVAYLVGRMTLDAPMGDMDYEPEKWDAARYRDKESTALKRGRIRVATAVVEVATGQVAGVTDIGVNSSRPDVAYQWDTIVDPDHRGHRLGMVLKSWNHQHLVQSCVEVTCINTWNAASNTFMIAVNDALGFEPVERWTEYQLDL